MKLERGSLRAHLQSGSCLLEMCPVDCALSDWTSWSECSVSCGAGISERNREVEAATSEKVHFEMFIFHSFFIEFH